MKKIFFILLIILISQPVCEARSFLCNICIFGIDLVKSVLRSNLFNGFYRNKKYNDCLKNGNKDFYCKGISENVIKHQYFGQFAYINNDEFCMNMNLCTDVKYVKDKFTYYLSRILKDKGPYMSYETIGTNVEKPINFIVVADIHMDFDYVEVFYQVFIREKVLIAKNQFVVVNHLKMPKVRNKEQANLDIPENVISH